MIFSKFTYPAPLRRGSRIGITGPSGGVAPRFHNRLDYVIQNLKNHGFEVVEGDCLRDEKKHVSAEKTARARDLQRFLLDDSLDAISPPWGGEVLIEILPLLDFEKIQAAKPKWITSYSDISTLHFAITTRTGIATAQTPNLMDFVPRPQGSHDAMTELCFEILSTKSGAVVTQNSSSHYQVSPRIDFEKDFKAGYMPTLPTQWKSLNGDKAERFEGRLIGGCLDTISCLTGTYSGNLENFRRVASNDGMIFYFENCEGTPPAVVRMVQNMRQAGWFDGANGILVGRSLAPDTNDANQLNYVEALHWALDGIKVPVIYDVDIGHQPPQMTLINSAKAEVIFEAGKGSVSQRWG